MRIVSMLHHGTVAQQQQDLPFFRKKKTLVVPRTVNEDLRIKLEVEVEYRTT